MVHYKIQLLISMKNYKWKKGYSTKLQERIIRLRVILTPIFPLTTVPISPSLTSTHNLVIHWHSAEVADDTNAKDHRPWPWGGPCRGTLQNTWRAELRPASAQSAPPLTPVSVSLASTNSSLALSSLDLVYVFSFSGLFLPSLGDEPHCLQQALGTSWGHSSPPLISSVLNVEWLVIFISLHYTYIVCSL